MNGVQNVGKKKHPSIMPGMMCLRPMISSSLHPFVCSPVPALGLGPLKHESLFKASEANERGRALRMVRLSRPPCQSRCRSRRVSIISSLISPSQQGMTQGHLTISLTGAASRHRCYAAKARQPLFRKATHNFETGPRQGQMRASRQG